MREADDKTALRVGIGLAIAMPLCAVVGLFFGNFVVGVVIGMMLGTVMGGLVSFLMERDTPKED